MVHWPVVAELQSPDTAKINAVMKQVIVRLVFMACC